LSNPEKNLDLNISGNLEAIDSARVFRTLFVAQVTGLLKANEGNKQVMIWFESGKPTHARLDINGSSPPTSIKAGEAVCEFALWKAGEFVLSSGATREASLDDACSIDDPGDKRICDVLSKIAIPVETILNRQRLRRAGVPMSTASATNRGASEPMPEPNKVAQYRLKCSICAKTSNQVQKLISGPGVYICDQCVDVCKRIIDGKSEAEQVNIVPLQSEDLKCSFCGKRSRQVSDGKILGSADMRICSECVDLCITILEESGRPSDSSTQSESKKSPSEDESHHVVPKAKACSCSSSVTHDGLPKIDLPYEKIDAIASKFYAECVKRALSTEPVDHATAESSISQIYVFMGLERPKVIWLDSPFQLMNAQTFIVDFEKEPIDFGGWWQKSNPQLKILDQVARSVIDHVFFYLWNSRSHPRWDLATVLPRLGAIVRSAAHTWETMDVQQQRQDVRKVWHGLQNRLAYLQDLGKLKFDFETWWKAREQFSFIMESLSVKERIEALQQLSLWRQASNRFHVVGTDLVWGRWSLQYQIGFSVIAKESLAVSFTAEESARIDSLKKLAAASHAFLCYKDVCFMSEAPLRLAVNEQNILHSDSGPAVAYRDGFEIYAWNGTRVPKEAIMQPATVDTIAQEQNVEVRRALIERYGLSQYLLDCGATKVHSDDFGTLYKKDLPNDEPITMVEVKNCTADADGAFRTYVLRVPPDMETALAAVAWTFGMQPDDYKPDVET